MLLLTLGGIPPSTTTDARAMSALTDEHGLSTNDVQSSRTTRRGIGA